MQLTDATAVMHLSYKRKLQKYLFIRSWYHQGFRILQTKSLSACAEFTVGLPIDSHACRLHFGRIVFLSGIY